MLSINLKSNFWALWYMVIFRSIPYQLQPKAYNLYPITSVDLPLLLHVDHIKIQQDISSYIAMAYPLVDHVLDLISPYILLLQRIQTLRMRMMLPMPLPMLWIRQIDLVKLL